MRTIFSLFEDFVDAEEAVDGLEGSGVLLWVRTGDERAPATTTILEAENGKLVASHS